MRKNGPRQIAKLLIDVTLVTPRDSGQSITVQRFLECGTAATRCGRLHTQFIKKFAKETARKTYQDRFSRKFLRI
jgi:hypothetical protein